MKIALVELANTNNISLVNEGEYWLALPDGSQISPVYAGWVGTNYRLCNVEFDSNIPTYLHAVNMILNPGTGYVANNILTISGGTYTTAAKALVYSIGTNGIVTSLLVANSGFYTSNPVANNSPTGGDGSGVVAQLAMRQHNVSDRAYAYYANTNVVIETNTYATPVFDNQVSIELQRQRTLSTDSSNSNLKDKLRTATAAQIDTWLVNNVTDLASARTVLGAIIKFLANKYPRA